MISSRHVEKRSQRQSLLAEAKRQALESLNDAEQKTITFDQERRKADTRGRQPTLTAPVEGTVQQLAIHTVGGVVTPAQPLLIVVPKDKPLEIDAQLDNKDVGFVRAGQEAVIKVETFPFTKYGTIAGRVNSVSEDAVVDEKKGLVFTARVDLLRDRLQVDERMVKLQPGMAVTVEIRTGERRVIEYFLSPLLQAKDESLRER